MTVFWTGGTPDLAGYGPRTMAYESQNMTNSKCGKLRHMIWVSHGQEHLALPEYTGQRNPFVGETEATYQISYKCNVHCAVHGRPSKRDKTGPKSFFFRQTISTPGNRAQKEDISDDSFDYLQKILTHISLVAFSVVGGSSLQRQSRLSASC